MSWTCTQCGNEPEAPLNQWLRERGYPPQTPPATNIRLQWHYETGTGEEENWKDVPAEWAAFDSWRYRKLCTDCAERAVN